MDTAVTATPKTTTAPARGRRKAAALVPRKLRIPDSVRGALAAQLELAALRKSLAVVRRYDPPRPHLNVDCLHYAVAVLYGHEERMTTHGWIAQALRRRHVERLEDVVAGVVAMLRPFGVMAYMADGERFAQDCVRQLLAQDRAEFPVSAARFEEGRRLLERLRESGRCTWGRQCFVVEDPDQAYPLAVRCNLDRYAEDILRTHHCNAVTKELARTADAYADVVRAAVDGALAQPHVVEAWHARHAA